MKSDNFFQEPPAPEQPAQLQGLVTPPPLTDGSMPAKGPISLPKEFAKAPEVAPPVAPAQPVAAEPAEPTPGVEYFGGINRKTMPLPYFAPDFKGRPDTLKKALDAAKAEDDKALFDTQTENLRYNLENMKFTDAANFGPAGLTTYAFGKMDADNLTSAATTLAGMTSNWGGFFEGTAAKLGAMNSNEKGTTRVLDLMKSYEDLNVTEAQYLSTIEDKGRLLFELGRIRDRKKQTTYNATVGSMGGTYGALADAALLMYGGYRSAATPARLTAALTGSRAAGIGAAKEVLKANRSRVLAGEITEAQLQTMAREAMGNAVMGTGNRLAYSAAAGLGDTTFGAMYSSGAAYANNQNYGLGEFAVDAALGFGIGGVLAKWDVPKYAKAVDSTKDAQGKSSWLDILKRTKTKPDDVVFETPKNTVPGNGADELAEEVASEGTPIRMDNRADNMPPQKDLVKSMSAKELKAFGDNPDSRSLALVGRAVGVGTKGAANFVARIKEYWSYSRYLTGKAPTFDESVKMAHNDILNESRNQGQFTAMIGNFEVEATNFKMLDLLLTKDQKFSQFNPIEREEIIDGIFSEQRIKTLFPSNERAVLVTEAVSFATSKLNRKLREAQGQITPEMQEEFVNDAIEHIRNKANVKSLVKKGKPLNATPKRVDPADTKPVQEAQAKAALDKQAADDELVAKGNEIADAMEDGLDQLDADKIADAVVDGDAIESVIQTVKTIEVNAKDMFDGIENGLSAEVMNNLFRAVQTNRNITKAAQAAVYRASGQADKAMEVLAKSQLTNPKSKAALDMLARLVEKTLIEVHTADELEALGQLDAQQMLEHIKVPKKQEVERLIAQTRARLEKAPEPEVLPTKAPATEPTPPKAKEAEPEVEIRSDEPVDEVKPVDTGLSEEEGQVASLFATLREEVATFVERNLSFKVKDSKDIDGVDMVKIQANYVEAFENLSTLPARWDSFDSSLLKGLKLDEQLNLIADHFGLVRLDYIKKNKGTIHLSTEQSKTYVELLSRIKARLTEQRSWSEDMIDELIESTEELGVLLRGTKELRGKARYLADTLWIPKKVAQIIKTAGDSQEALDQLAQYAVTRSDEHGITLPKGIDKDALIQKIRSTKGLKTGGVSAVALGAMASANAGVLDQKSTSNEFDGTDAALLAGLTALVLSVSFIGTRGRSRLTNWTKTIAKEKITGAQKLANQAVRGVATTLGFVEKNLAYTTGMEFAEHELASVRHGMKFLATDATNNAVANAKGFEDMVGGVMAADYTMQATLNQASEVAQVAYDLVYQHVRSQTSRGQNIRKDFWGIETEKKVDALINEVAAQVRLLPSKLAVKALKERRLPDGTPLNPYAADALLAFNEYRRATRKAIGAAVQEIIARDPKFVFNPTVKKFVEMTKKTEGFESPGYLSRNYDKDKITRFILKNGKSAMVDVIKQSLKAGTAGSTKYTSEQIDRISQKMADSLDIITRESSGNATLNMNEAQEVLRNEGIEQDIIDSLLGELVNLRDAKAAVAKNAVPLDVSFKAKVRNADGKMIEVSMLDFLDQSVVGSWYRESFAQSGQLAVLEAQIRAMDSGSKVNFVSDTGWQQYKNAVADEYRVKYKDLDDDQIDLKIKDTYVKMDEFRNDVLGMKKSEHLRGGQFEIVKALKSVSHLIHGGAFTFAVAAEMAKASAGNVAYASRLNNVRNTVIKKKVSQENLWMLVDEAMNQKEVARQLRGMMTTIDPRTGKREAGGMAKLGKTAETRDGATLFNGAVRHTKLIGKSKVQAWLYKAGKGNLSEADTKALKALGVSDEDITELSQLVVNRGVEREGFIEFPLKARMEMSNQETLALTRYTNLMHKAAAMSSSEAGALGDSNTLMNNPIIEMMTQFMSPMWVSYRRSLAEADNFSQTIALEWTASFLGGAIGYMARVGLIYGGDDAELEERLTMENILKAGLRFASMAGFTTLAGGFLASVLGMKDPFGDTRTTGIAKPLQVVPIETANMVLQSFGAQSGIAMDLLDGKEPSKGQVRASARILPGAWWADTFKTILSADLPKQRTTE